MKKTALVIFLLLLGNLQLMATHIRAGEITARRISESSLRYRIKLVIYRDTETQVDVSGVLFMGDGYAVGGSPTALSQASIRGGREINVGQNTSVVTYEFDYTYRTEGQFRLSYIESNRNGGIINLGGFASASYPFYVETLLTVSNSTLNSTPELTIPPLDGGCLNARFVHIPGAYDVDGDSLSFRIVPPKQSASVDIPDYLPLDDPSISQANELNNGPPTFNINPTTGLLSWDASQFIGEYTVAFLIEEWRKNADGDYVLLGYVTRDMQIIVRDCSDERPTLTSPEDICIEAGTVLEEIITGRDPNEDLVLMEAFGGVFEVDNSPAEYINLPDSSTSVLFRDQPADNFFRWKTNFSHVRDQPYNIVFKVSDVQFDPSEPSLIDFKSWQVKVMAPAPQNLISEVESLNSIKLQWSEYAGADFGATISVYRKTGSTDIPFDECTGGIPSGTGYEKIAELSGSETEYLDTSEIFPGVQYCYRLVAKFPAPKGGTSYVSDETCSYIPPKGPAITKVSVMETDELTGSIDLQWTKPLALNSNTNPGPYSYQILRSENRSTPLNEWFFVDEISDTVYQDINLNTKEQDYYYRLITKDNNNINADTTTFASSVKASSTVAISQVNINWQAEVPWSNNTSSFPYHYIYRNRTDANAENTQAFELIDSVDVTVSGFEYSDKGEFGNYQLRSDREYCYYVTTSGAYGIPEIVSPLINNSQIICTQPLPEPPPPAPEIIVEGDSYKLRLSGELVTVANNPLCNNGFGGCSTGQYSNTVKWTINDPNNSVVGYNIYYSRTGKEDDFELIGSTVNREFTHTNLDEIKGCYKVKSYDISNQESSFSETLCFDNCPYYELPNTFTPNADGKNDTFRAFNTANKCSRFVRSVTFTVYDRWGGKEIYQYNSTLSTENNLFINWDGKDKNGVILPSGVYYYKATVVFDQLDPNNEPLEIRNWLKIIR